MTMTMTSTTTHNPALPGTLHLPTKKDKAPPSAKTTEPPAKTLKIAKPLNPDRAVIETRADVSPDLAPEHRKPMPKIKAAQCELAKSLVELTRDVPATPYDTRQLRLAIVAVELAPECSANFIAFVLKTFASEASEAEREDAEELRRAIFGSVNSARLARFRTMLESSIAVVEARRVEAPSEKEGSATC